MEMIKIRNQQQSAIKDPALRKTFSAIMVEVLKGGPRAMYEGSMATLLRDVPFSLIYFPFFSNLKKYFATFPQSSMLRVPDTDHETDATKVDISY